MISWMVNNVILLNAEKNKCNFNARNGKIPQQKFYLPTESKTFALFTPKFSASKAIKYS